MIHDGLAENGHYYSYVFDRSQKIWWKLDDHRVSKATEEQVKGDSSSDSDRSDDEEDERDQAMLHNKILEALDQVQRLVKPKKKSKKPVKQKTFMNDEPVRKSAVP